MTAVTLANAMLNLRADPSQRVLLPFLTAATPVLAREGTEVLFVGNVWPSPFTGPGRSQSITCQVRYPPAQNELLLACLDLLERAHDQADPRLILRTHVGIIPGLSPALTVVIRDGAPVPSIEAPDLFDLAFTAIVVAP